MMRELIEKSVCRLAICEEMRVLYEEKFGLSIRGTNAGREGMRPYPTAIACDSKRSAEDCQLWECLV